MRKLSISVFALALVLGASSCYIDEGFCCDETEIIRFENRTGLFFDNYIDDRFVGQVPPHGRLEIEGDYEGRRLFESVAEDDLVHCGPEEFRIHDGDLFVLELDNRCDFKIQSQARKPAKP